MGFRKNQKRHQAKKISKIRHGDLIKKSSEQLIKQQQRQQKEKDMAICKIENNKSRQQSSREKLLVRMRGLMEESINFDETKYNDDLMEKTDQIKFQNLSNLSSFYKEFSKVLESADVLIEVLDARDPLGTRCEEIEKAVIQAGPKKRLILLLNKVDLIPTDNLKSWLKYLRNEFPTIAFKSSTQKQKTKLGRIDKDILNATESMLKSSKCIGANHLMKILGNYCRNAGLRTAINVGVVGYPNVGKSSVINSLIRNRSCSVGSTPGSTKSIQYIYLDSKIKLLDSPGIVFAKPNNKDNSELQAANLALKNCIKIEQLNDVILPVKAILARVTKDELIQFYDIKDFKDVDQFLILLAMRFGKLKKGGIPDIYASAKKILNDWNSGRIKYYTSPPDIHLLPTYISTDIIEEFSKGFQIDHEDRIDKMIATEIDDIKSNETMTMEDAEAKNEFEQVLNTDKVINFENVTAKEKNRNSCDVMLLDMQLNKKLKLNFKKQKKKERRITKLSEKMSKKLEESLKLF